MFCLKIKQNDYQLPRFIEMLNLFENVSGQQDVYVLYILIKSISIIKSICTY